jgi:hypothetical protein
VQCRLSCTVISTNIGIAFRIYIPASIRKQLSASSEFELVCISTFHKLNTLCRALMQWGATCGHISEHLSGVFWYRFFTAARRNVCRGSTMWVVPVHISFGLIAWHCRRHVLSPYCSSFSSPSSIPAASTWSIGHTLHFTLGSQYWTVCRTPWRGDQAGSRPLPNTDTE